MPRFSRMQSPSLAASNASLKLLKLLRFAPEQSAAFQLPEDFCVTLLVADLRAWRSR